MRHRRRVEQPHRQVGERRDVVGLEFAAAVKAGEALLHVGAETGFAELTVADDVDAGIALLSDDLGYPRLDAVLERQPRRPPDRPSSPRPARSRLRDAEGCRRELQGSCPCYVSSPPSRWLLFPGRLLTFVALMQTGPGQPRRCARRWAGTRPRAAGCRGSDGRAWRSVTTSSRLSNPCSAAYATTSPAHPPVSGPSSTTTSRLVFSSDESTVSMIKRPQRTQVDHLGADPGLVQLARRRQAFVHADHHGHERDVAALAHDQRLAERRGAVLGDVSLLRVQALVLEEQDRVVVPDRSP